MIPNVCTTLCYLLVNLVYTEMIQHTLHLHEQWIPHSSHTLHLHEQWIPHSSHTYIYMNNGYLTRHIRYIYMNNGYLTRQYQVKLCTQTISSDVLSCAVPMVHTFQVYAQHLLLYTGTNN